MGVEYDLVSDSAREGYELGKGPWGMDEFAEALRSSDPVAAIVALLADEEEGFSPEYAREIAEEIAAFARAHPDWRVINDAQSDIYVADETEEREMLEEGEDPNDPICPVYRRVGTRYRETVSAAEIFKARPEEHALIALGDEEVLRALEL